VPKVRIIRRGGRMMIARPRRRRQTLAQRRAAIMARQRRARRPTYRRTARRPSVKKPMVAGRPVVTRPEEFYSVLAKTSNSYQPGIDDKTRFDFFTLTPDPEKQYGNYAKAYIEMPANIQGIKVEFYPTNPTHIEATSVYRDAINALSEGVLTLYVNDQPVGYWRVDDIAHAYSVDPWYDTTTLALAFTANIILNDQPFTIMKDLLKAQVVKTRGRDRIYASIQIASSLAAASVPTDFMMKCTLLIRPKRLLFS